MNCPKCSAAIERPPGVSPYEDHPYKSGDVIVCDNCAEILIIDDKIEPQIITKEQIADFRLNRGNWAAIKKLQNVTKMFLHDQKTHPKKT